jgi:hypothetical protein
VGFWIKGSVAGNYSAFLGNNAGRSYLVSVPVTTSWAYQTVSITGDTSGTWPTTNAAGMYLGFDMGSDASRYSTAGSWLASNVYGVTGNLKFISQVNGSTLNITGVQLEKGSTATSFDYRPYGTELQLAQRYYYLHASGSGKCVGIGGYVQAAEVACGVYFPVTMRSTPTLSAASGTGYYTAARAAADVFDSFTAYQISTTCSFLYNTAEASGTSGASAYVYTSNASASVAFTAEL